MNRLVALPLALALIVSCATPPPPVDAAASASTAVAVDSGLPFAANTQALFNDEPTISIDGTRILLDDAVVGDTTAVTSLGRLQRIDGEFDALKKKREAWKEAHPGTPFPGVAVLKMPRATKALVVKSVFQTAAFAGFPNLAFVVETGPAPGAEPHRLARINADAQIPGPPVLPQDKPPAERVLFVSLVPGSPVVLTWKVEGEVVSVVEVPWAESFVHSGEAVRAPALAAKLAKEWAAQGQHRDPSDKKLDQVVVQIDNATELRDLVAVLDALYEPKRDLALAGARVSAFYATLSIRGPGEAVAAVAAVAPKTDVPTLKTGSTSVSGRLPPEIIQRIVRQNFGPMRKCYEAGLKKDAKLTGRISVSFVIGIDGAVTHVADTASELPDPGVVKCVLSAFSKLAFPAPEGGIVKVVYPIVFSPADAPAKP